MSPLQRLLLLPLLSPLLAVLLVGALNPRPWLALRLLVWSSPALPLGAWISAAAATGAALSASASLLALRAQGPEPTPRRQVRRRSEPAGGRPQSEPEPDSRSRAAGWPGWAGPARAVSEPAPTVSVPFRVIRRRGPASPAGGTPQAPASSPQQVSNTANGDGWDGPGSDDW